MMRILMCTDGSRFAEDAIHYGTLIAQATQAEVTILGVIERPLEAAHVQASLAQAQQILSVHGLSTMTKTRQGHPDEEILSETEETFYDMVIVGQYGRRGISRFWLGPVTERIVEHAHTSVLVVKGKRDHIASLLICTSGTEFGDITVQHGVELARALDATVTILHVISAVPVMYTGLDEMDETLPELLQTDTREARHLRRGEKTLESLGVKGKLELRHGIVPDEILRAASEGNVDLIVIGSSQIGGNISRYLMGDVTRQIVHYCKRPVLVVRSRAWPRPSFRFSPNDFADHICLPKTTFSRKIQSLRCRYYLLCR